MRYSLFLLLIAFAQISIVNAEGSDPFIRFHETDGQAKLNSNFTLDVEIYSGDNDLSGAQVQISYDPTYVEVIQADRFEDLFCNWPADSQLVDNTEGLLKAYGFCQSGSGTPYNSGSEADIMLRLVFKAKKAGDTVISFDYIDGSSTKTALIKDGTPPDNVLTSQPSAFELEIVDTTTSSSGNTNTTNNNGNYNYSNNETPLTSIWDWNSFTVSAVLIIVGILVFILGDIYIAYMSKKGAGNRSVLFKYEE